MGRKRGSQEKKKGRQASSMVGRKRGREVGTQARNKIGRRQSKIVQPLGR